MRRFFALALMVITTSAFGEWRVQTVDNGSGATYVGTTYDLNHRDRGAALNVIRLSDGKYLIAIDNGATPIYCPPDTCKLTVKFGDGQYVEYPAHPAGDGKSIMPRDGKRFAMALSKVDVAKINLPFYSAQALQLIFEVKDLPVVIDRDPKASFLKYALGERRENIAGLPDKSNRTADGKDCFGRLDAKVFVNIAIQGTARSCFVNGELAILVLEVPRSRKADLVALDRGLDTLYGKPGRRSQERNWPSATPTNGWKQWHTKASTWSMDDQIWYVLVNEALSDVAPMTP